MRRFIESKMRKRLRLAFLMLALLFAALVVKLFQVQIIRNPELTEKAMENWDRELPFAGVRGEILDRSGRKIIGNKVAPTLYFMPSQNRDIPAAAAALAPLIGADKSRLEEQMSKRASIIKLAPEGKNIPYDTAIQIGRLGIPGLYTGVDYVRDYPYGNMLSRLVGFTGYDNQGLAGIEYEYEKVLTGKGEKIRMFTDARGNPLPHVGDGWIRGKAGANIELTIDLRIQEIVERELSQAMLKYDADQALAIVMDPGTGEILALASAPNFDPSDYASVDPSIYNRNLPVWMTFEPGSTFKIITLASALEEGVVNLKEDSFFDPGHVTVGGARLRCWKREGHGPQTFLEVVENSCNPGFIELGRRVGPDKLTEYIRNFGFGSTTGSGIAGEASGILFSKEAYGPVEHATTSFGQGISVTPIQQAQAVAAAVNGGRLMQPYIVKRIVDPETGKEIERSEPVVKRQVISEEASGKVREALESVVANGSGRNAFTDGLRVGGKTGTAQKVEEGRYKDGDYIVSFIGFAPADDPDILVYVAVDGPENEVQFGGVISAPMVGRIISDIAPLRGIEPRDGQMEREYRWGDPVQIRVPDLTGRSRDELVKMFHTIRIEWNGPPEGQVIRQLPAPGTMMEESGIIHLYAGPAD
ncbi:stage V sporulation protein D (sporulation-specific penicillin-binding protein) [Edaphobacillus lindanitolerans]|uniref:serine-type D-Ala-D-Ala carboxypeptidase n=2 Tax=Edaphobacillus lindanitolerans TaxID=550447 RepID=A0A1U7PHH8_9BACI|nr:stage V sporulation protein D (sporulation-specific penicillin-binding protein) [Edaphobacillus lindanitolerans]